jgi:hypothetical protein
MAILKRYNICHSDNILSINDMTNASIATGQLIVGVDGTYNMHFVNLTCNHATGKRKRTLNKEIVNLFEECEDLCLVMHQMIGYVWNKKAKSRKKCNKEIGYNVIKVGIDNDMRISGYVGMYQHALHCKWTLHQYFTHEKSSMCNTYELSNEHWQSMAEVETIIQLVCALSFMTQIDS